MSTICERGLAEQKRLFDSTSNPVIYSLENLSKIYESYGFLKEAESIYRDIINRWNIRLEHNSLKSYRVKVALSRAVNNQAEDLEPSEIILADTLEGYKMLLGSKDVETLTVMH